MTVTVLTIIIAVLVLAAGLFVLRAVPGVRAYFKFRGKHLVTCPETQEPEAVDVAAGEAALGAFYNEPTLRLNECSRWPERQNCGQDCLSQIEADPQNCLVWNIVAKWYEGKSCAFCQKPIGTLHHLDHAPAVYLASTWVAVQSLYRRSAAQYGRSSPLRGFLQSARRSDQLVALTLACRAVR